MELWLDERFKMDSISEFINYSTVERCFQLEDTLTVEDGTVRQKSLLRPYSSKMICPKIMHAQ